MTASKYHILVVDDEHDLCEILKFNLEMEGYTADVAHSAEDAHEMIKQHKADHYHLLMLDVMMSGMSGFALTKILKASPATRSLPIIFLTARDTENDTITGLNLGADDYIAKPFSLRECMARVKAVLRRTAPQQEDITDEYIAYESLRINPLLKTVTLHEEEIPLTKTEYELLYLLMSQQGKVFSRQQLIDRIWPRDVIVSDRTVDVNITRLRKKIGPYSKNIVTRLGFGYYFNP